ncbi:carbamoyltransferase HypF [Nitrospira moscoviensis]|uniref:Carbamoyltransferase n=1 Tax=Nitrospira moscoviensis TaxID=42253 RepID=A0A088NA18_NITMO|nr:carbamoyltransferase HypF [Nitrospira moscoviensis]AIN51367.1 carbamoyltransferase [Nitrospira moscoviensis]ALA58073.1 Carbamoyltransferase HypF [Nitrospira moscoviensis]
MTPVLTLHPTELAAVTIRVRGLVQGVGFRPAVWRLAQEHRLRGHVLNDGQGVRIYAIGAPEQLQRFLTGLQEHPPTLARIVEVVSEPASLQDIPPGFTIIESGAGEVTTGVVPDAATCHECLREVLDPFARRYRYPFTNCTHCGPRLTIQEKIPYDRSGTTMSGFPMCPLCEAEYHDPSDRRFHAQPIACHACGPRVWLERADGKPIALDALTMLDAVDAACTLLQKGRVVAIKGLGGVQLACDATQEEAVSRLRRLKAREGKPFALMARDLQIIRHYCEVSEQEVALLRSPAAPIVILKTRAEVSLAPSVAPGIRTLGFMLPNTPLHHLMLRRMDRPIVLTSGNRSDEPQWIDNEQAKVHLGEMAEYFLLHDRGIAQRVDDSVAKVMGGTARMFRRSRGYAPAPVVLPPGFDEAPRVLAMGGELKNTFCLIRDGHAVLSHHIGDLEDALTQADYRRALGHYRELFAHVPQMLAIDRHPDYLSSKIGREMAADQDLPLCEVQHHHAHIAACLAENGIPIDHPPVLGMALDGLGYGDDGTLWGGEFLLADYRTCTRVGTFKPVPMLGGEQAVKEPWRNTYAHLMAEMGWARFVMNYGDLDLYHYLAHKPRVSLDQMIARGINSPSASSCGRLFDAVAAAMGICRDRVSYEGQAAVELEQVVDQSALEQEDVALAYPFTIPYLKGTKLPYIEPLAMWQALLGDLILKTPLPVMAARFHKGLAKALCAMVDQVTRLEDGGRTVREVALSGGVFQNQVLFEFVKGRLEGMGFRVLSHAQVPTNDGGLALGQAVIAAAKASSHKK